MKGKNLRVVRGPSQLIYGPLGSIIPPSQLEIVAIYERSITLSS